LQYQQVQKLTGGIRYFSPNGDMIYATKENTVEKSIKDICDHIPPSESAAEQMIVSMTDRVATGRRPMLM